MVLIPYMFLLRQEGIKNKFRTEKCGVFFGGGIYLSGHSCVCGKDHSLSIGWPETASLKSADLRYSCLFLASQFHESVFNSAVG